MRLSLVSGFVVLVAACARQGYDSFTPASDTAAASVVPSNVLRVRAKGDKAGGVYPHMQVAVDGTVVGAVDVSGIYQSYDFAFTEAAADVATVEVQFTNDAVIRGQDRNLYVRWVSLAGDRVDPTASTVVYDRGPEDGQDLLAGSIEMAWSGTLIFSFAPTAGSGGTSSGGTTDAGIDTGVCTGAAGADSTAGRDPTFCAYDAHCTGVTIAAGSTASMIQSAIDDNPAGTTFCFAAGTYRLDDVITPKTGDVLKGAGALLSGSLVIPASSISQQGSMWMAANVATNLPTTGRAYCLDGSDDCLDTNQLYLGGVLLVHAGSKTAVTSGMYWYDGSAHQVFFADDPAGKTLEMARTQFAIWGDDGIDNVTVSGFTIEEFGTEGQLGAVYTNGGSGWTYDHLEVRANHGLGLGADATTKLICNYVHHNGQMGVGGNGDDIDFEHNEVASNNTALYDYGWEAGGLKFAATNHLKSVGNYVHHNYGPGHWTDIDNINTVIENNRVENNDQAGIMHEISFDAVIRHNTVLNNGFGAGWYWGAGLLISASQNVESCGNLIRGNNNAVSLIDQGRGQSDDGRTYMVANDTTHDNLIYLGDGSIGAVEDTGDDAIFSRNNVFNHNTYHLSSRTDPDFAWDDDDIDVAQWQAAGQDTTSTFSVP